MVICLWGTFKVILHCLPTSVPYANTNNSGTFVCCVDFVSKLKFNAMHMCIKTVNAYDSYTKSFTFPLKILCSLVCCEQNFDKNQRI